MVKQWVKFQFCWGRLCRIRHHTIRLMAEAQLAFFLGGQYCNWSQRGESVGDGVPGEGGVHFLWPVGRTFLNFGS